MTPFSVSYDRTTTAISAIVCIGLAGAVLASHSVAVGCTAALVIGLAYAYSPRGYTVSDQAITVRRLIGNAQVSVVGLREIRPATPDDFRGCIRLWGNGGLFGYYGLFRTSKLGKCSWYVTHRQRAVVLVTDSKTALFSPDDVVGFIATIQSSGPIHETAAASRAGRSIGTIIAVGIATVALVAGALAFLYAPGPPRLTLTHDTLTIQDRFYPFTLQADSVDVTRIRIVDISRDSDWRPTGRTNGFANSHYHSGWFRVARGQKVRMYWADGKRLVLVPPKSDGTPVLIEVREPEEFIKSVRRVWAHP